MDELFGLLHHVTCTATNVGNVGNVGNVTVTLELLHGKEDCVPGDSGYTAAESRPEFRDANAASLITKKRRKLKAIKNACDLRQQERWENCTVSMCAKVKHPFPDHQAPVWLHQGVLSRLGQKQRAGADAVCVVRLMYDLPAVSSGTGTNRQGGTQHHLQNSIYAIFSRFQVAGRARLSNSRLRLIYHHGRRVHHRSPYSCGQPLGVTSSGALVLQAHTPEAAA